MNTQRYAKTFAVLSILFVLALSAATVAQAANTRVPLVDPDFPQFANGGVDTHDFDWAVVFFYHEVSCIPDDANLFFINFDALDCPLTVEGFSIFSDDAPFGPPIHIKMHGNHVPHWILSYDDFMLAMADGNTTKAELRGFDSLLEGTADVFNQVFKPNVFINGFSSGTLAEGEPYSTFSAHGLNNTHSGLLNVNINVR